MADNLKCAGVIQNDKGQVSNMSLKLLYLQNQSDVHIQFRMVPLTNIPETPH